MQDERRGDGNGEGGEVRSGTQALSVQESDLHVYVDFGAQPNVLTLSLG